MKGDIERVFMVSIFTDSRTSFSSSFESSSDLQNVTSRGSLRRVLAVSVVVGSDFHRPWLIGAELFSAAAGLGRTKKFWAHPTQPLTRPKACTVVDAPIYNV
jgi:hypothetical protein